MYHSNLIYHVYNQSNNYESLFKSEENYRYFTRKMRRHLTAHADILAYCLMPDHFHWLLIPTAVGCAPSRSKRYLRYYEGEGTEAFQQQLSNSIKTLLSSYTQAVNKQIGRRGSLFKSQTKSKPCLTLPHPEIDLRNEAEPFSVFVAYVNTCFNYIHQNPVKAGLVSDMLEWEYSSALQFAGFRENGLANVELAKRLIGNAKNFSY